MLVNAALDVIVENALIRKLLTIFVLFGWAALAQASGLERAQEIFREYVARESAFDPSVADLYSDSALILNKRTYPTGQVRELNIPASQYKSLIRSTMPLAKLKNDKSTYSMVSYAEEGGNVRIKAARYSIIKKYVSPISILVGPENSGAWKILEEISESQP